MTTRFRAAWLSVILAAAPTAQATDFNVEIVNLTASILLAAAFVPYGIRIIADRH